MAEPSLIDLLSQCAAPPRRMFRRGRQVCRHCGEALTALSRGRGACDAPECRKKERSLRDRIRRERDEVEVAAMRAAAASALKVDPRQVRRLCEDVSPAMAELAPAAPALALEEIAATCHVSTPIAPPSPEAVEEFRSHFERVIRYMFDKQDTERALGLDASEEDDGVLLLDSGEVLSDVVFKTFERREVLERPAHPAERAACAACRGRCCEGGTKNLVYIRPSDVARFRRRNRDATPASMVGAFLAFLPEAHVRDSCLFHGVEGCSLPRDVRSSLCNGFKCHWLLRIGDMIAAGAPPRLVAGFEAHRPRKAVLIAEDGSLVEAPVDSSISSDDLLAEAAAVARGESKRGKTDQTSFPDSPSPVSFGGGTGS